MSSGFYKIVSAKKRRFYIQKDAESPLFVYKQYRLYGSSLRTTAEGHSGLFRTVTNFGGMPRFFGAMGEPLVLLRASTTQKKVWRCFRTSTILKKSTSLVVKNLNNIRKGVIFLLHLGRLLALGFAAPRAAAGEEGLPEEPLKLAADLRGFGGRRGRRWRLCRLGLRPPVAITVTWSSSSIDSSKIAPKMVAASGCT